MFQNEKISKKYDIILYNNDVRSEVQDDILVEFILSIVVNNKRYVNLVCTNKNLYELVLGNLLTENIINDLDDIKNLEIDKELGKAFVQLKKNDVFRTVIDSTEGIRTITTACGKQYSIAYYLFNDINMEPLSDNYKIYYKTIIKNMNEFQQSSEIYKTTRGSHSCGLYCDDKLICLMDDIGRHNTVDKILGYALKNKIDLSKTMMITSGRVSSDMLTKIVKARIPVLAARSIATDTAIEIAKKYNVTLIGYIRSNRMNVYNGDERILS